MDWQGSIFTVISLRSFSSIWYWIILTLSWSAITHNPLGVPFDMVLRARRQGGADLRDLEAMVGIQIRRRQAVLHSAGVFVVGVWAAVLTGTAVLGFRHGVEIAQAVTLLLLPISVVGLIRVQLMARLTRDDTRGEELCKRLTWHRTGVQAIGLLAILITALWGMWYNLNIRTLGG